MRRRSLRRRLPARSWRLVALALAACPAHLSAAEERPARVSLSWALGPEAAQCIQPDELRRQVSIHLSRPAFVDASQAELVVDGKVRRDGPGWVADITLRRPSGSFLGRRQIETTAEHCSALDEPVALALALMIDLTPEELEQRTQEAPRAPRRDPAPQPPAKIAISETAHAPRKPWKADLAVLGALSVGLVPDVGFGTRLAIGVEPPSFPRTELELAAYLATQADATTSDSGTKLQASALALLLCPLQYRSASIEGWVCGGQSLGLIRSQGFGFVKNQESNRLLIAGALRARGALRLSGPLSLRAGVGADVPLLRDRFVYRRSDGQSATLFRPKPVVGTAELGLGLSF